MVDLDRQPFQTWLVNPVIAALLALFVQDASSASWQGVLQDGRQFHVDPSTNRAIIQSGSGAGSVLWDGVHTLDDGSVITVRSGLMVPNEEVMTTRHTKKPAEQRTTARPLDPACDDLVVKTCGLTAQCDTKEACDLAKQLRETQRRAVAQEDKGSEWSASQCQSALADEAMFPSCEAAQPSIEAPCRQLVERLCGTSQRCEASEACQMSRQLLTFEEKLEFDLETGSPVTAQQQCQELLVQHAFFPPCR